MHRNVRHTLKKGNTTTHTQVGHTSLAEFLESFNKPQTGPRTPAGRPLSANSNSNSPHAAVSPYSPPAGRHRGSADFGRPGGNHTYGNAGEGSFDETAVNGPDAAAPMNGYAHNGNGYGMNGMGNGGRPPEAKSASRTTRTFVM